MPAYNAEDTIFHSIKSILNQSYNKFELIIIDDSSNDNTVKIISEFQDRRIKLLRNKSNLGVSYSRNKGIKSAKGIVIGFCDSDDEWLSTKLECQLNELNSFDIVCSNYTLYKNETSKKIIYDKEFILYSDMLKFNLIPNSSAIYNAGKLGKVYQKNIGAEDYLMWLELIKRSDRPAYRIQKPLMKYNSQPDSLSANKIKSAKWRWHILVKELGINYLKAIYLMSFFIVKNLKKHLL